MNKLFVTLFLYISYICIFSQPAYAYIGPGAGFAVIGSGFFIIISIGLGILSLLFLPFKFFIRKIRKLGIPSTAKFKRVMVIGYDGLDPKLFKKFSSEGKLPNLTKLSESGSFKEVQTTIPALSPVAWSSFQTGVNPGAHNIFDFLTRDKRSYLPQLASSELQDVKGRMIPFITRKSKPFWHHLGKKGIPSTILRVPISYPPESFNGRILSAMTTPDLLGTQGTFCLYSTNAVAEEKISGIHKKLVFSNGAFSGSLSGPLETEVSFSVTPTSNNLFIFEICGEKLILKPKVFSPWISVRFSKQKIRGIIKVRINEVDGENLVLYTSPINIDPEAPALPISEPPLFSRWIAKTQGLFGTLGFLEDTWGRNEGALNDEGFLEQAWENFEERKTMLFETMKSSPHGFLSCVFDTTDRVQHMFWRYLEEDHPAPKENEQKSVTAIEDLYTRFDELTGEILSKLSPDDLLFIISDHGFGSFKRAINFNTWLMKEGYLVLKEKCGDITTHDYLKGVDWSKTKAFGIGLTGLYINKKIENHQELWKSLSVRNFY